MSKQTTIPPYDHVLAARALQRAEVQRLHEVEVQKMLTKVIDAEMTGCGNNLFVPHSELKIAQDVVAALVAAGWKARLDSEARSMLNVTGYGIVVD